MNGEAEEWIKREENRDGGNEKDKAGGEKKCKKGSE